MEEEEITKALGANVKRLRLARGLTQSELGDRAGLSLRYIQWIEGGTRSSSIITVLRISRAMGITLSKLMIGVEDLIASPKSLTPKRAAKKVRKKRSPASD